MHTYITDNAGVLAGPVELPVIPGLGIQVPSNAIQLAAKLVNPAAGKVWALVDGQPQQLADYRGTVYSTATGAEQQHSELGDLPEGLTTERRPSADHRWSGNGWAFDAALQAANHSALQLSLCEQVDTAADAARNTVAGDPLRAVEYDRARMAAEQYAAANYQGNVPPMVAAWAINGRTPQQAADSILAEAAQYTTALVYLRTVRLNAKELIRNAMAAGEVEQAEDIAAETIASIEAAVAGIGNNAG
ncbi:hypothetical protein [Pseudomonas spirodelae]|uniref:Phage tail protein n=1 Tax=Pseudomonas spirodelae TaxID=3101751 RepID=A0ABU5P8Z2_9PSED|nr:hypothetical protein [Pseudomonas sp. T5W1]MEA1606147.1 hypothetical protein [Pseudomonas sp. T5W1]